MMRTIVSVGLLLFSIGVSLSAQSLRRVTPDMVGLSAKQLAYADESIQRAISDKEIPGAVLMVVRHQKIAYLKAYGNKRLEPQVEPMDIHTVFDLASCTKPVATAISTMILVERGLLRFEDPVSRSLPHFQGWIDDSGKETPIRVIDLLTHTSGLPAYAPVSELQKQYGRLHPEGLVTYISECKRHFKPQAQFQYSCLNYITLQQIIQKVSGQNLRDFAKQNIFDVLGMKHTDFLPLKEEENGFWGNLSSPEWQKDIAPTEQQSNGQILCGQVHDPLARVMNGGISGNAGLFSNANDLAILVASLLNGGAYEGHRILSKLAVNAMFTVPRGLESFGRTPGWDSYSAYSSNKGNLLGLHTVGHTGYTGTSIVIDPDHDLAIILLTNAVHPKDATSVVRLRGMVANTVAASVLK